MTADWAIMLQACLRHDEAPAHNCAAPAQARPGTCAREDTP